MILAERSALPPDLAPGIIFGPGADTLFIGQRDGLFDAAYVMTPQGAWRLQFEIVSTTPVWPQRLLGTAQEPGEPVSDQPVD